MAVRSNGSARERSLFPAGFNGRSDHRARRATSVTVTRGKDSVDVEVELVVDHADALGDHLAASGDGLGIFASRASSTVTDTSPS